MKKGLIVTLGVMAGIIILAYAFFGGTYNRLVRADEAVSESWAQVQNVYQRRADLIPNLVETVKGYAAHERETLQAVIEARARATSINVTPDTVNSPEKLANFEQAQSGLTSALSRLLVAVEQYPDLKANQNFLALQTQLEGTENRIAVERMRFNQVSRDFNTKVRVFPANLLAGMYGFSKKAYFQAEELAAEAPKVSF